MSCGCNNKKKYKDNKKKYKDNKDKELEHFSYEGAKNMCHYSCSSINTTNILLLILIIFLIYLFLKKS